MSTDGDVNRGPAPRLAGATGWGPGRLTTKGHAMLIELTGMDVGGSVRGPVFVDHRLVRRIGYGGLDKKHMTMVDAVGFVVETPTEVKARVDAALAEEVAGLTTCPTCHEPIGRSDPTPAEAAPVAEEE